MTDSENKINLEIDSNPTIETVEATRTIEIHPVAINMAKKPTKEFFRLITKRMINAQKTLVKNYWAEQYSDGTNKK